MYIICSPRLTLGLTVPPWHHKGTAREKQTRRGEFILDQSSGLDRRTEQGKQTLRVRASGTLDIYSLEALMPTRVFVQILLAGRVQTQSCSFISISRKNTGNNVHLIKIMCNNYKSAATVDIFINDSVLVKIFLNLLNINYGLFKRFYLKFSLNIWFKKGKFKT